VHGMLLAAVSPDNTPHGYNLTFAFPMLMFIIIAGGLYLRFRGTHRIPGHVGLASSRWASTPPGAGPVTPHSPAAAGGATAASVAHGATLDAAIGETTPGSTLHEGTSADGAEGSRSASTEDSE
jgi:hypothetical protein